MPRLSIQSSETSAVLRALALLEHVVKAGEAASLEELTEASGLPKPTVYRILRLLSGADWLRRETAMKRYTPGPRVHSLALQMNAAASLHAERHAVLEQLVRDLGETCNLTMLEGSTVLYVDRVETSSPIRLNMEAGSRVPLHCTASGKLFLSAMPVERVLRLLGDGELKRYTARTTTSIQALLKKLAQIRKDGISIDEGEYLEGSVCLAVPVSDRNSRILATVAVHGPAPRLNVQKVVAFVPRMRKAAAAIATTFPSA